MNRGNRTPQVDLVLDHAGVRLVPRFPQLSLPVPVSSAPGQLPPPAPDKVRQRSRLPRLRLRALRAHRRRPGRRSFGRQTRTALHRTSPALRKAPLLGPKRPSSPGVLHRRARCIQSSIHVQERSQSPHPHHLHLPPRRCPSQEAEQPRPCSHVGLGRSKGHHQLCPSRRGGGGDG